MLTGVRTAAATVRLLRSARGESIPRPPPKRIQPSRTTAGLSKDVLTAMLPRKDVLVIDDDGAIRSMLSSALGRLGVTCDVATDGAEALERADGTSYSVMLVDLMMPRIDGETFVTTLRERESASGERPVVLLMTALRPRPSLPPRRQDSGRRPEPFDVIDIASLVHSCVEIRRELDAPKQAPATTRRDARLRG